MSQYIYDLRDGKSRTGIFWNVLSSLFFYFATVFVYLGLSLNKETSDAFVYAFYRYYIGSVFFLIILLHKKMSLSMDVPVPVLIRGVTNSVAVIFFYLAIQLGETGRANVLNMTYPAFVALLSGPFLKEYPDFRTLVSLVLCLLGIGMYFYEPLFLLVDKFLISDLLALTSGVIAAISIVSLRGSARIAPTEVILFWMFFIGVLVTLPFSYEKVFLLDKLDFPYLLASAVFGVLGQWFLTISYRYLEATEGSIISGLRIPLAMIFGFFFLEEVFSFTVWLGGILIFLSNFLLALRDESK